MLTDKWLLTLAIASPCDGCKISMGDLPDMYARDLRAAGPREEDIRTYQENHKYSYMLKVLCNTFIAIVTTPVA